LSSKWTDFVKHGYARVSTERQDLDMQLDALHKDGCQRFYSEKVSGVIKYKPEFEHMMRQVKEGDVIVVYSFSRISRSLQDLLKTLERFKEAKVEIKSLTEPVDTTTSMGKAFFQIIGVIAELERNIIVDRVTEGSKLARSRGQGGGRKQIMHDADIIKLKKLHAEKQISIQDLCNMFGISKSTLYKCLNK